MPSREDLKIYQSLPLDLKVALTQDRIRHAVETFGTGGLYVAFSGGKDSTVLLHLVRDLYPEIPAVFMNTGLEYPEVRRFAMSFENVAVLTPRMTFKDVIIKYGYPFFGKEIAKAISEARRGLSLALSKFDPNSDYGHRYPKCCYEKWKPALGVDFNISARCCDVMKKAPAKAYFKSKNRTPITGQMAEESRLRLNKWVKYGCNAFETKSPMSNPMAFWTEQDVLAFIKTNGIAIAEVYGDIVAEDPYGYQYDTFIPGCRLRTTGCARTGCIFCAFGAHLEKESRFVRLKKTHPKQYDYCMDGGGYDDDGLWKPNEKGLGMAHCVEELCKLFGKDFIRI